MRSQSTCKGIVRSRRGYVLLVTISLLALLSLLATAFVTLTRIEQQTSVAYSDQVRARMLAISGIDHAVGVLRRTQGSSLFSIPAEQKTGGSAYEFAEMFYYRGDVSTSANDGTRPLGIGIPLRRATRPSYIRRNAGGSAPVNAPTTNVDDQAVSGFDRRPIYLPGLHIATGDHFRLKIFECSMMINLNMAASQPLQQMLVTLVDSIYDGANPDLQTLFSQPVAKRDTVPAGKPAMKAVAAPGPTGGLAEAIVTFRNTLPGARFSRKEELLGVPGVTQDVYNLLKDYVTVYGFGDHQVSKPIPDWPKNAPNYDYYTGAVTASRPILANETRFPVNMNAAPPEVLVAVIASIRGKFVQALNDPANPTAYRGTPRKVLGDSEGATIPYVDAVNMARRIVSRRRTVGAFKNWREVKLWLVQQKSIGPAFTNPDTPDLVWANCNPNSMSQKVNPDVSMRAKYDKFSLSTSSLVSSTTEFCLGSQGVYEFTSLGRVMDRNGGVLAEQELSGAVQIFEVLRVTLQRDFNDSGNVSTWPEPAVAGVAKSTFDGYMALRPISIGANPAFLPESGAPLAGATTNGKLIASVFDVPPAAPNFGDVVPDGVLCLRERKRPLIFSAAAVSPDAGTIEGWVKLATDPLDGSDEPLLYTVKFKDAPGIPSGQSGVAWKLERFGTLLVSTRFWWVKPASSDPNDGPKQMAPYTYTYTEKIFDITAWRAGQWHHIIHSWSDGVTQSLLVDGSPAFTGVETLTADTRINLGTTTSVDNSTNPPTNVTTTHYSFITYTIASNNPVEQLSIGGFGYAQPAATIIKETGTYPAGDDYRGANATIDDVLVYGVPNAIATGRRRYLSSTLSFVPQSVNVPVVLGRLDRVRTASGGSLRILAAGMSFYPCVDPLRPGPVPTSSAALSVGGTNISVGGANDDSGPLAGNPQLNGPTLNYSVAISTASSGTYDTPIVDDVTFLVSVPAQFFGLTPTLD